MIEDDDLSAKYNTIRDKVSSDMKKEFDSEPVYNKGFLKTKIKFDGDEVTDFYDQKIPKVGSNHTFLAVISLDSAFWLALILKDEKYFLDFQVFEKKVIKHIIDNLSEFSSSDESDEE